MLCALARSHPGGSTLGRWVFAINIVDVSIHLEMIIIKPAHRLALSSLLSGVALGSHSSLPFS